MPITICGVVALALCRRPALHWPIPSFKPPMSTFKRIPVDQLKPGMFVVALDRPWLKTPFLLHRRRIKQPKEILTLKHYGIQYVTIDVTKGADVDEHSAPLPIDHANQSASAACSFAEVNTPQARSKALHVARQTYNEARATVDRFFEEASRSPMASADALAGIVGSLLDRLLADRTAMLTHLFIRQMREYDHELSAHALDTGVLTLLFGATYGLSGPDLEDAGLAALLHDIGYLRLPRNVFRKAHQCSEQERRLMEQHPKLGATLLKAQASVRDTVRHAVEEHHERIDGSGFPARLSGAQLSSLSQLIGLADAYQSLVCPRGGTVPLLPHRAVAQMFSWGQQGVFDRTLVEAAIACLGIYPIGSLVQLNSGERAIVVATNPHHRLHPVIAIIADAQGHPHRDPVYVDLSAQDATGPTRTIMQAMDPAHEHVDVAMYLDPSPPKQTVS